MALGTLTFLNSVRDYTRLPALRSESPIRHLWGHCRLQVGAGGTGKRLELGVRGPLALWLIEKPPVSSGPDAGSATATAAGSSSAGTDPGLVLLSVVAGGQRLRHRVMEAIGGSGSETGSPHPAVVLSAAASPGGPQLHAEVLRCLDERGCAAVRCGSTTEVERAVATLAAVRRQLNAANRDMVLVPQLTARRAGPGECSGSGDNLAHGNTCNSPSGSRAAFLPQADANLLWDIGSIGTMLESIVWEGDLPPRERGMRVGLNRSTCFTTHTTFTIRSSPCKSYPLPSHQHKTCARNREGNEIGGAVGGLLPPNQARTPIYFSIRTCHK